MSRTGLFEHDPARDADHPTRRLLGAAVLLELIWVIGLLVVLGVVSVILWAVLDKIFTM